MPISMQYSNWIFMSTSNCEYKYQSELLIKQLYKKDSLKLPTSMHVGKAK